MEVHIKYLNAPQNLKGNCTVLIIHSFRTAIPPQSVGIPEMGAVVAVLGLEAVAPPTIEAIEAPPEVTEAGGNPEAGGKLDHRTTLQVEEEV